MIAVSQRRFLNRRAPPHIVTLILLSGLSALVMNVFLPSLPRMTAFFETDYGLMQLSVAGYLVVNALAQLVIGPVSDKLGRRPVILWGIALFMLATLGCLLSTNIWVFLMFRMAQAVIVTGLVLSRAIVRDMVGQNEAASMIGYVTMGMAVVPMIAPMIGGALDILFGWHAAFVLMLALGGLVFWLAWVDLGETHAPSGQPMWRQFAEFPELLRSQRFWGYALASGLSSGAFFAYLGGAPFVGEEVFGLDPFWLGVYFGSPAIGYFCGNWISGMFSARVGVNRMVLWGALINTFGLLVSLSCFSLGYQTPFVFFGCMTFVGLGNGLSIPNATAGMLSVRPHLAGTASGFGGAIMLAGGGFLSALAGALLATGTGAWPLLYLQCATGFGGICAIVFVIWREKQLGV
ncbi:MAG: multidrug effflux MFS transporter [Marinovum sp.]|nr:multidrug effflux MFS transporter [Marinovum sp.]